MIGPRGYQYKGDISFMPWSITRVWRQPDLREVAPKPQGKRETERRLAEARHFMPRQESDALRTARARNLASANAAEERRRNG